MRLLTSLAGAAALALVCALAASAGPRMYLGFLDDLSLRYAPTRAQTFDAVRGADASVVRTIVRWYDVAPTRPADPSDPLDPAYHFDDLDEFVVAAQERGIEVLLTIWGTPPWANGGQPPNVPPTDASDLEEFAHALAARYSGALPAFPHARFFSIWNEPNSPRFLSAPDPPAAYARLAAAGYAGVKSGSPSALVAIGETAASHAPASFMEAVAHADPTLRFDAWSHHPYPASPKGSPKQAERWPDVGFQELEAFSSDLDASFGRTDVPIWLTEYAESASVVGRKRQAADLRTAISIARSVPAVQMFVWLMLHNHPGDPWQSGLIGTPALSAFRGAALPLDPRNPLAQVSPRQLVHVFQLPALELKWHLVTGERIGVLYQITACGANVEHGATLAHIRSDGWVPVAVPFRPSPGVRYTVQLHLEDVHGLTVDRTVELVGSGAPERTCNRQT